MNMYSGELQWCRTIPPKSIYSNQVHVWRVFLNLTTVQIESLREFLSVDELTRAARFHFERDQKRFIAARGILRKILGHYLDMNPHEIHFDYTRHGKPMLASKTGGKTICFNLSHSDEFVLYAVSHGQSVGIDIERIRDNIDMDQITQRFFSQSEIRTLKQVQNNKWSEVFFQYWTRKEAFLKAMGKGISIPMDQCDVSLINGKSLSRVTLQSDIQASASWYVKDLFPGCGYVAALAVEEADSAISYWHYSL